MSRPHGSHVPAIDPPPARPEGFRSKLVWLVIGLVLGAVLTTPVVNSFRIAHWRLANSSILGSPDCNNQGWYSDLPVTGTSAQSEYDGDTGTNFFAENTTDNNRRTAWAGRFRPGSDNNVIAWSLDASKDHVEWMCIRTGYRRGLDVLANNNRPHEIVVRACGKTFERSLRDSYEKTAQGPDFADGPSAWAGIRLDCDTAKVSMSITSVYPALDGSHQVAISDVRFLRGASFLPST